MPSQFDSMMSSGGGNSQLEVHHAEDVTHYPGGGSGVTVSVIVIRPEPVLREVNGIETRQGMTLLANSSITCKKTDRWEIDGKKYETLTVGELDAGERPVELTRVQKTSQGDADPEVL